MSTPRNRLLDTLSQQVRDRILTASKYVSLPARTTLQPGFERPTYCYFLTSGITSCVIELAEGGSAEVTLVGAEGFVDGQALLGSAVSPTHIFMQTDGDGYRIRFDDLKAIFLDSEEFRTLTLQLVQQQSLTMGQLAACNKLHDAEARLSRWILMADDRLHLDVIPLTQEFIAQMLGTRRTTVALSAGSLQRSGLIEYSRGRITILSRERLEEAACECYPVVATLFHNLYKQDAWGAVQDPSHRFSGPPRNDVAKPKPASDGSGQALPLNGPDPDLDQEGGS